MDYSRHVRSSHEVPQNEPVPDKDMVANNAGGFAFQLDKWAQLDRFLVLGTEGGTYYCSERDLTLTNFKALDECLKEDAVRVVDRAVELSVSGRAPKNDPALFILAKAASDSRYKTVRQYALRKMPEVARIGTHLFHFVQFANKFRGWGRAFKRGIGDWYGNKTVEQVAFQVAKYKQRDGWSHRDLLRLAHPKTTEAARNNLYQKITHPETKLSILDGSKGLQWYGAAEEASVETDPERAAQLIREYQIPRECVNTQLLNDKRVWNALLENMPMTALIRNLGKLSSLGMTGRHSAEANHIVRQLSDGNQLKKARVHPVTVLGAMNVYKLGHGIRGGLSWEANRDIVDALNDAFYAAFNNITSTNKRYLLGLDISGSMWGSPVVGIAGLNAATAAGAMAMVTLRSEQHAHVKAFTCGDSNRGWFVRGGDGDLSGFIDAGLSSRMMLDQVLAQMQHLSHRMGGTDCALPMVWATKNQVPIDVFCVYTDSETWAGNIHPFEALKQYRKAMGIPAKLVVVGTSANDVSIADPSDAGMLDVVGFDSSAPQIISDFVGRRVDTRN